MNSHYVPQPKDTGKVELPADVKEIAELAAENIHDIWAKQRIADGWKYGVERNDELKEHPGLVPYGDLPDSEKKYDKNTALETVRFLLANGYEIKCVPKPKPACFIAGNNEYAIVTDEGLDDISLPEGDFPVLWTSNKRLPSQNLLDKIINRCFLLLDADVLRKNGAMISSRVSWERTATELVWQI
jgi:hypothetical protein